MYESAEKRALNGAYKIMTRGTPPRPFFAKGAVVTQAEIDAGWFDGGTLEDVVEALKDNVVQAHLESNNRQDDDPSSFLAKSVKGKVVDRWHVTGDEMSDTDMLSDAVMPEVRWTSVSSRYRRTCWPALGSGSWSSTWPTAPT